MSDAVMDRPAKPASRKPPPAPRGRVGRAPETGGSPPGGATRPAVPGQPADGPDSAGSVDPGGAPGPVATVEKKSRRPRVTAETLAAKQRDISVSEFFAKNRHLLGFDNPRKALLTAVKEAVDNSLDACEEAGILPEVTVVIEELGESGQAAEQRSGKPPADGADKKKPRVAQSARYRVTVVDNGPGIVRQQVENVFGRLLFGSKFHRLKMSRGQQGIGISAAGMYGLITTGRPMLIQTRPKAKKPAHHIELAMNTKTNRAEVTVDEETEDFPLVRLRRLAGAGAIPDFLSPELYPTGTSVSIELEGKYQRGRGSVDEFLELTAIANPHARIVFVPPRKEYAEEAELDDPREKKPRQELLPTAPPAGPSAAAPGAPPVSPAQTEERDGIVIFPRAVSELPPETREIQPHPRGVELGTLLQMLKDYEIASRGSSLYKFLQERFSRVSAAAASAFCEKIGVTSRTRVSDIEPAQAEALYQAFQEAKLAPPPTDCLAPIGVRQLLAGLLKGVRAEFYAASTRDADVYRGRPFQIEAALAFGGELPADEPARVIRFANRVPLLYQQSACSSFKAVADTNWRNYDLQHPKNSLPIGPLVIMIHMASVWVPFTSESKEAIADYDEIRKEMRLALMECGRKLGAYISRRARMRREGERRDIFERYIGEIAQAAGAITGTDAKELYDALLKQAKRRTAIADARLDEEGKVVKEPDGLDEGVVIVDTAAALPSGSAGDRARTTTGAAALGLTAAPAAPARTRKPRPTSSGDGSPTAKDPTKRSSQSRTRPPNDHARPSPGDTTRARTKPRARLVNGKLVPVDPPVGPSLF